MKAPRPVRVGVKRVLPRSLFGRALLIIAIPAIIVQAITTYIFYERHWDALSNRLAMGVAGEIAFIADRIEQAPTQADRLAEIAHAQSTLALDLAWFPNGTIPPAPDRAIGSLERPLANALAGLLDRPFVVDAREERSVRVRVQLPEGVLHVAINDKRIYSPTTYIFILWMLGSALVLFAIAVLFMRNQIRPIRRLAIAADRFGRGLDAPRFKPEGAAEVRQAASAFIEMRDRIERQIRQRTDMLAGVSHDLRTPLTRMKLQLAFLPPSPDVDELKADIGEMESMIEGYLAFARGEGGEQAQPTDIGAVLGEIVDGARRENGCVELTETEPAVLPLRRNAFRRGVANLVSNASRYASHVWVGTARRDGHYEIVVDDDGPGIPSDQREDVFRPFYRLEASRNRATGGVGLGLTIARDVARSHGGDVLLEESPQGGLRAVMRLPL